MTKPGSGRIDHDGPHVPSNITLQCQKCNSEQNSKHGVVEALTRVAMQLIDQADDDDDIDWSELSTAWPQFAPLTLTVPAEQFVPITDTMYAFFHAAQLQQLPQHVQQLIKAISKYRDRRSRQKSEQARRARTLNDPALREKRNAQKRASNAKATAKKKKGGV
jgi:hypothetical protein